MFSVFSSYLSPFIEEGLLQDVDQTKIHCVYEQLRIAYNQGAVGIINTTKFFVPYYDGQDPDEFDDELLYVIYSNDKLQKIITWFNSKVIPELPELSYLTLNVRMRIAISKIFKLVESGELDKKYAIRLHMNLTETLRNEVNLMLDEDLPF